MKLKVTKKRLENLIENFFDLTDNYDIDVSEESMAEYLSEKLKTDKDSILNEFSSIIKFAVEFNEREYLFAINKKFDEAELKESFKNFIESKKLNEKKCTICKDELMKDPTLKLFRKTNEYKNSDLDGKYKSLWRYVVHEFGTKINDEEEIGDICMEIAMHDDQQF